MKNIKYICMILILALGLTGCGGPKPDEVVGTFLEAFHAVDFANVAQYAVNENGEQINIDMDEMPEFFNGICNALSFENITVVSTEKDSAKVSARVTTIDGALIYSQFLQEGMETSVSYALMGASDAEIDVMLERMLNSMFNATDAPKVTNTISFELIKIEGDWKVIFSEDLLDSLSGGAMSSFGG